MSCPLAVQEAHGRRLLCDQGILPWWAWMGFGSLCARAQAAALKTRHKVQTWKTDLSRRNKSWNLHEQLPWAQWTSLYLEKLTVLSLNIEMLSEKGLRSTVASHRSQRVNTFLFAGASQGKLSFSTGLGKAVPSVPPLVRVPPVIPLALLTVQLGLSLESKLVSFEITFRYSNEHSSLQALLLAGTRMTGQAWLPY